MSLQLEEKSFQKTLYDFIKKMDIWGVLESFFPLYILFILAYTYLTGKVLFSLSFMEWFLVYVALFPASIIFLAFFGKIMGYSDYRFKVMFHVLVIGIMAYINGLMLKGTGMFSLLSSEPVSLLEIVVNYSILLITSLPIVFGAVMNIYNLSTPFLRAFGEIHGEIESGNLAVRLENEKILNDSAFGPLAILINKILETSAMAIKSLKETSELMTQISVEIASLAEETNAATEVVASSTTNLTKGTNQQADAVLQVAEVMEILQGELNDVVDTIAKNSTEAEEIAQMTHILSLNASIEASRAGESARGFVVIAENVRKLASDSKRSAEEINRVVKVVTESFGENFSEVKGRIEEVSSLAEENAASTEEISASIQELAANMERLAEAAQNLASNAAETEKIINRYHT